MEMESQNVMSKICCIAEYWRKRRSVNLVAFLSSGIQLVDEERMKFTGWFSHVICKNLFRLFLCISLRGHDPL